MNLDPSRHVGFESRKAYARRCREGFWRRYLRGPDVIDIAPRGGDLGLPIVAHAKPVELGDPGYDGLRLPFPSGSQDAVHASHVLEHVAPPEVYIAEWFRVLKAGGFMVLFVPHAFLYERRLTVPPSRWSGEHLRSYTPATLLAEVEYALAPNTYRVEALFDDDDGYDYRLPPDAHPIGCLEIGLVIRRIAPPSWRVEP
jgi:SAM-dependent methyltransferase